MKSQKGFTLVEVLALIMLVAGTSVGGALDTARKRNYRNEFIGLMDAARLRANLDMMDNKLSLKHPSECITIAELVADDHFKNPHNYEGSVLLSLGTDRKLTITGWMAGDLFMVVGKSENLSEADVVSYVAENFTYGSSCGQNPD